MKKLSILLLLLAITSCQSTLYIIRHAEKGIQPKDNPPLTEAGKARAEALKMALSNKNINLIYSTNTIRTFSTAKPISSARGVMIEYYVANQPDSMRVFIEKIKKKRGKNVLIVGHSNTVKYVVNGLYEHDTLKNDIPDNVFDRLYIVKRKFFPHKTSFVEESYGN